MHQSKYCIKKLEDSMIYKLKQTDGKLVQTIMIADFKMKFEPILSRETTLSHYGKRGIGWHGVNLMYYRLEEHVNDGGIRFLSNMLCILIKLWLIQTNRTAYAYLACLM